MGEMGKENLLVYMDRYPVLLIEGDGGSDFLLYVGFSLFLDNSSFICYSLCDSYIERRLFVEENGFTVLLLLLLLVAVVFN